VHRQGARCLRPSSLSEVRTGWSWTFGGMLGIGIDIRPRLSHRQIAGRPKFKDIRGDIRFFRMVLFHIRSPFYRPSAKLRLAMG
jgi:hypothetical protein